MTTGRADYGTCENRWYRLPESGWWSVATADLIAVACHRAAVGRFIRLGASRHGRSDSEVALCDSCRESVEYSNAIERAMRDGTLAELLGDD